MQGVNLGTVKSRLVRGRAMLRMLLNPPAQSGREARPAKLRMPLGEEAR
jgi:hypothetical protein